MGIGLTEEGEAMRVERQRACKKLLCHFLTCTVKLKGSKKFLKIINFNTWQREI